MYKEPETPWGDSWKESPQFRKDLDELAKKVSELEIQVAELAEKLEVTRLHTSYRNSYDD